MNFREKSFHRIIKETNVVYL